MAWNTDQIYSYLKYQLRKNNAGGISAGDFFNAWNSEQSALHSDLLGRWQKNSNSKEGANTGLIENETIMTKLTPFTQTTVLPVVAGQATKPADFIYPKVSLRYGLYLHHFKGVPVSSLYGALQPCVRVPTVLACHY